MDGLGRKSIPHEEASSELEILDKVFKNAISSTWSMSHPNLRTSSSPVGGRMMPISLHPVMKSTCHWLISKVVEEMLFH